MIRARITSIALVAVASIGCTPTGGNGAESDVGTPEIGEVAASERAVPMIVDYSPTLSDVPALLFLATRPDVELLAVTLPGTGESDCEPGVRHTRSLLVIAGRPDVPVACGREGPMAGDRDWPLSFREASRSFPGVVLPHVTSADQGDAVELLSDTLDAAEHLVSIVALGPLTNLGRAFDARPELADRVASIVTMGGAFDVAGNVFDTGDGNSASADAEWNFHIDPASVRASAGCGRTHHDRPARRNQ